MATIQSPPNSVWPNGLQTDSEGYAIFYPLGTNKVDISTITWPEGSKVVSPFVYQDDKLVGFIDTKALEIDNNDTTIDINYTHFDADLDSIMENTLTINAPANATVNVKYGAVDKVLTEKIEKLIGKEKCEVKFDKNNNKATIAVALDTTETQIADVESLLTRVLPSNLETEMEWADGLPITYTPVEYLESTGTQYITTGIKLSNESELSLNCYLNDSFMNQFLFGARINYGSSSNAITFNTYVGISSVYPQFGNYVKDIVVKEEWLESRLSISNSQNGLFINNERIDSYPNTPSFVTTAGAALFGVMQGSRVDSRMSRARVYSAKIIYKGRLQCNLVPCLNDTGTPGMYDTVTKVFKSNMGTGDFLYPTDAVPAMSAGLDETFYAKLTEHGVRRLYHVPNGCTMTKDEYAAANGFKELVEPPMPLEGYWMPEWRETETQLICDWVETELPTEEVETLNNENQ